MSTPPTATNVAEYMVRKLEEDGLLYQAPVAWDIANQFGDEFVYMNQNGNRAIAKPVLAEFRRLTGKDVIWVRGGRFWRRREDYDDPGRRSSG